jgi:hypothetical protein
MEWFDGIHHNLRESTEKVEQWYIRHNWFIVVLCVCVFFNIYIYKSVVPDLPLFYFINKGNEFSLFVEWCFLTPTFRWQHFIYFKFWCVWWIKCIVEFKSSCDLKVCLGLSLYKITVLIISFHLHCVLSVAGCHCTSCQEIMELPHLIFWFI